MNTARGWPPLMLLRLAVPSRWMTIATSISISEHPLTNLSSLIKASVNGPRARDSIIPKRRGLLVLKIEEHGEEVYLGYALNTRNVLVHVVDVPRGKACECRCVGCGRALIAKKGEVLVHHFAHANNEACSGSL